LLVTEIGAVPFVRRFRLAVRCLPRACLEVGEDRSTGAQEFRRGIQKSEYRSQKSGTVLATGTDTDTGY
jgi:hypothetical protein